MRNVYVIEPLPGVRIIPFLASQEQKDNRLFQEVPWEDYGTFMNQVNDPASADIMLVPHEYAVLRKKSEYLAQCQEIARTHSKPLLISAYQDDPSPIQIPGTIILRSSAYKSQLGPHEVIMPAYIEDIGRTHGYEPMTKPDRASVGFVGKAGFSNVREAVRYVIRNYFLRHGPDREGMYFRRHALASLARESDISLDVTARRRFSGHRKTIEIAPEDARKRYIESLKNSLFTLAPRGDGNFSLRFFETMAVGRIPVLIDTDAPLPLEDLIPYNEFIVRIPWQQVDKTGALVAAFFASKSAEEIEAMQRKARQMFETYLYMPKFLEYVFNERLSEI